MQLINGDCLEVMRSFPDSSVDAIVTDPPYFRVKGEAWDRQWDDADEFIAWIGKLCEQWHRILKPNGSLYVWASPKMAARVEVEIGRRFAVLNRIRWVKSAGWHQKTEKEALRSFLSPWEECIFAEHFGEDGYATQSQCLVREVFQIGPLSESLGITRSQIASLIAADYKNIESAKAQASNWILGKNIPNPSDFARLKTVLPIVGEYEDLRQEFEDLRRPFSVTPDVPWHDVWDFPTVKAYPGKHPCEKPVAMLQHIIRSSTRPGAVVLDCFMGSGATGEACQLEGREFIGIELDARYFASAQQRLTSTQPQLQLVAGNFRDPELADLGEVA